MDASDGSLVSGTAGRHPSMAQENSDSQISRNKDLPSSSRTPNSTLSADVSAPTRSAKSTMSRRKVKGLTHTGRQVSEDPDLDNLLSILSPEEVEELQMDLMKVPDLKPEDGKIIVQGENQAAQAPVSNNVGDAKLDRKSGGDPKGRLSQRENSFEVCEHSAWLVLLVYFPPDFETGDDPGCMLFYFYSSKR